MVIPPQQTGWFVEHIGEGLGEPSIENAGISIAENIVDSSEPISNYPRPSSARIGALDQMTEREFADYEMREAHKLGLEADSSKYQRAYEDLVRAGLNPRLAIESLNGSGVSASSGYSYSQSDSRSQSESKSNSFSTSALIVGLILAAVKIAAL